jgi:hypothetical protein
MAKKTIVPDNSVPAPVIPEQQQNYIAGAEQNNEQAKAQSAGLAITPTPGSLNDPNNRDSPYYGMTQDQINNHLAANDPYFSGIKQSVDANAPLQSPTPSLNVPAANDNQANPVAATEKLQSGAGAPLYDPNNPVNIFERYMPQPTPEMDAQRAEAIRNGAAISDSFAALADMFAHGSGAYVRPRDMTASQTAEARVEAGQQKDRDRSDAYKNALLNIAMNDFDFKRKAGLQNAQLGAKLQNERAIQAAKNQLEIWKKDIDKGIASDKLKQEYAKLDAQVKNWEDQNKIAKQNADTGRINAGTNAYRAQTDRKKFNLNKDKYDDSKSVDVTVGHQTYKDFDKKDVGQVVARAIQDGNAKIQREVEDPMSGKVIGYEQVNVTPTTKLTAEQVNQIFNDVYPAYVSRYSKSNREAGYTIEPAVSNHDFRNRVTAHSKHSTFSLGGVSSR